MLESSTYFSLNIVQFHIHFLVLLPSSFLLGIYNGTMDWQKAIERQVGYSFRFFWFDIINWPTSKSKLLTIWLPALSHFISVSSIFIIAFSLFAIITIVPLNQYLLTLTKTFLLQIVCVNLFKYLFILLTNLNRWDMCVRFILHYLESNMLEINI